MKNILTILPLVFVLIGCVTNDPIPKNVSYVIPKGMSSGYKYSIGTDKLTGTKFKMATARSDNSIQLSFPYQGAQKPYLAISRFERFKHKGSVSINVDKGQINPIIYNNMPVIHGRFDNEKPVAFMVSKAHTYGSGSTVTLVNGEKFITYAKKVKKIILEVPFYNDGTRVITFTTKKGLDKDF